MYTDLIYDFDGTISDTYPIFAEALLVLLDRHNIKDSYENAYALLKKSVGIALKNYEFEKTYSEISKEYNIIHNEMALQKQMPYEDAKLLLESAKRAGKRNFIYTHSGKLIYKLMDKWGLSEYITDSMDGTFVFPRKPNPAALNFLIEKNNINKKTALMVGDRDIDIDVAHNAGIAACLYDYENYYPQVKAEHKVMTLSEIISFI